MPLDSAALGTLAELRASLPRFAAQCLQIRTKDKRLVPFKFNRAQTFLHERLEEQKKRTGKVRALVLKGRQQGVSTYVTARYFHSATMTFGLRVFILTHEQDATDNLFEMVNRLHEHMPEAMKPRTGAASAKELWFDKLDSGYKIGTAGTKAVGRSQTIQRFHGSEVAHWPHADTHAAGVMQAVADMSDTEIILESTANGLGNFFHQQWQEAEMGSGDYEAIFIPWYWQDEYRKPAPPDFSLTPEEEEYRAAHGLDLEQMAWKRGKTKELGDELLFKQEYPATAAEAFQLTGHDSYIPAPLVLKARKNTCEGVGPLVIGADPARAGGDAFSIARRKGRKVSKVEYRSVKTIVEGAAICKQVIDEEKPARFFIDVGGLGVGVYDLLVSWGYGKIVRAVNFGGEPINPPKLGENGKPIGGGPRNRRAEMWMTSKEWLEDVGGADIPDDDRLQTDACAPGYTWDSNTRLVLESKEAMRRRGVRSPDGWDSVVLTFAEPVSPDEEPEPDDFDYDDSPSSSAWMAI